MYQSELITVKPGLVSGTPVFTGTRVPIKTLFDYVRGNHSLEDFLDDFPTVQLEQAKKVLALAHQLIDSAIGYKEEDDEDSV